MNTDITTVYFVKREIVTASPWPTDAWYGVDQDGEALTGPHRTRSAAKADVVEMMKEYVDMKLHTGTVPARIRGS